MFKHPASSKTILKIKQNPTKSFKKS